MVVKVFSTQVCPKCQRLKKFLTEKGIEFKAEDMETAEGMAQLFNDQIFTFNAPVLQAGKIYLLSEQLFKGTALCEDLVLSVIEGRGIV
jgi:glutaredoxin